MCAQRKKSFAHKIRSTKISRKKFIKNNKRKIVCAAFDTRVVIMKINGSTNKFTRSFGGGFCCCFLYFSFQFAHAKSQNRIKRSWKHKTMNAHKKYSLAWMIVKVDSFITIRCSFVYAWVMRRRGRRAIRSQPSTLIPQHKLWWIIYCKLIVKCVRHRHWSRLFGFSGSGCDEVEGKHTRGMLTPPNYHFIARLSVCLSGRWMRCRRTSTAMIISFVLMESSSPGRGNHLNRNKSSS